jgi:SAM-dependent methyltransferase
MKCEIEMSEFTNPFASIAVDYARHRPRYPGTLFQFLADVVQDRKAAWDCATGSGQAAVGLAKHFDSVYATDASAEQLAKAEPHARIDYSLAPAEASGLPDQSVSVVTIAQAVHWFALDDFYAEAKRVLKPGGIIAIWGYVLFHTGDAAIDRIIDKLNYQTLKPYFDPRVLTLWDGYEDLPFPFQRLSAPRWKIEVEWSLDDLLGLISSWSGLKAYRTATRIDPLPAVRSEMDALWGEGRRRLTAEMPALIGRV